jgi:hypothetical protein
MQRRTAKSAVEDAKNADFDDVEDLEEEDAQDEEAGEEADEESGEESDEASEASSTPGRRSRGRRRSESRYSEEALDAELVDISAWPGTAEAAKIAGKHPGTIKLWRTQGRIRAQLDGSGCWRHHPDDLVESNEPSDTADPAALLATGMTSIVQQGERAGLRLLAMTELTTQGLESSNAILSEQLKKAYARIDELEKKLERLFDRTLTSHESTFKHERWLKRMENEHELAMSEKHDAGARMEGLLRILGPIGASIAARVVGNETAAQNADAAVAEGRPLPSQPKPRPTSPQPAKDGSHAPVTASVSVPDPLPVPIELRISQALGRLAVVVRELEAGPFNGLRSMLPPDVAAALEVVRAPGTNDADAGVALATVTRAACALSSEQFAALAPIAPKPVSAILGELRALMDEPA